MVIKVSGKPSFVTLHRVFVTSGNLEFESAYLLTTPVLEERAGSKAIKARDKKKYFHRAEKVWVQLDGESFSPMRA